MFTWRAAPCSLFPSLVEELACRLLLQALFTKSSHGEQLLAPPPFSGALRTPRSLCCRSFSVLCLLFRFFFCRVGGQSVQGAMLVYPNAGCGSAVHCLFAYVLVCVSQEDLELAFGGMRAVLVSQSNMAWRSFVRAGG
jgi:hypothetical protein